MILPERARDKRLGRGDPQGGDRRQWFGGDGRFDQLVAIEALEVSVASCQWKFSLGVAHD
jgi:hypothetical protein